MIILGIDPGVTVGFAAVRVIDGQSWELLARREVSPRTGNRGEELATVYRAIETTPWQLDVLAMEELLSYRQHSADEKVEAQAIVKLWCWDQGFDLVTYAPTTIRSAIMGSGKATPAEIKATLRFLCRMGKTSKKGEAFTVHQQDALAVALCHALRSGALQVLDRCAEGESR